MTHSDVADCIHQEPGAPCKCGLWELQDRTDRAARINATLADALAAAQARERELRAVIQAVCALPEGSIAEGNGGRHWRAVVASIDALTAALSAPQDTTALREFGLKVAKATDEASIDDHNCFEDFEAIVDAALKGTK